MEQFLIIRPMTPLNDPVLPGRMRPAQTVDQTKVMDFDIKSGFPFWMSAEVHAELESIVGPNQKKGGRLSMARFKTPATVSDFRSGWISEYFKRVLR